MTLPYKKEGTLSKGEKCKLCMLTKDSLCRIYPLTR